MTASIGVVVLAVAALAAWYGHKMRPPPADFFQSGTDVLWTYVVLLPLSTPRPEYTRAVRESIRHLETRSVLAGAYLTTVGVAVDAHVERGLGSLRDLADFDEVISGRGWASTGVRAYAAAEPHGLAVAPQLLLLEDTVRFGAAPGTLTIKGSRVLLRLAGYAAIREWVRAGFPLIRDGPGT